jgi:hypothetical protein
VTRFQLSGPHDSREWNFRDVAVTIVGFSLPPASVPPLPLDMFLKAKPLPDLETAAGIRDEFQNLIGVDTTLVLRTDPVFWNLGGPKCDMFDLPLTKITGPEFMRRRYIVCPEGVRKACRTETMSQP